MNPFKELWIRLVVVCLVLFGGCMFGFDECVNVCNEGFCQIIVTIGILMMVGAFLAMAFTNILSTILSFIVGLCIFLFGFGLMEYGWWMAIKLSVGCLLFFVLLAAANLGQA